MNEEGFNTGADGAGYIPVFGVDATAVAVEAINAGSRHHFAGRPRNGRLYY